MSRGSRRIASTRQSRWAVSCSAALALLLGAAPSQAEAADPCPAQPRYEWMGEHVAEAVTIPSLGQPNSIASYPGTIVRPADASAFPGRRPVVLIQHGLGGSQCAQWWTARDLAGHGYVTVVWTAPAGDEPTEAFVNAVDAMRSALAFARSAANPYGAYTDGSRVALAGHSLGSIVAGVVQQEPDPGVRALIALDTLRRWANGDPGGAVFECAAAPALQIAPRVPALGFAMDAPCRARPDFAPADLKLAGFEHWRAAGVPAMQLVMAGYGHLEFATPGSEQSHRDLAWYMEAWLDRWLLDDPDAERRLLAAAVLGRPAATLLSTSFRSGAYLPPDVDTTDLRALLADTTAPRTIRLHGPKRRIGRERARRAIGFRFRSADPAATFECRLDRARWRPCASPRRIRRARVGPHRMRVRATDARGNVEPQPAVWRFRVLAPRWARAR